MRATTLWLAMALFAACGRKHPAGEAPSAKVAQETPAAPAPPPAEASSKPTPEAEAAAAAAAQQVYRDAVEAKAHAHALRTRLGDQRTALAASLSAAEGEERDVLLLVHEMTAKEVFSPDRLMAIDTDLERADVQLADGRHAEALDAFRKAAAEIQALLDRLDRSEPKARAIRELDRVGRVVAAAKAKADTTRAEKVLAEGRRLLELGDFAGALARASEAKSLCDSAIQEATILAAARDGARQQRGVAEVALAAWDKYSRGTGGETDLSRAARAKLEEGDRHLAANELGTAIAAYQKAAVLFEDAIEASQAAERKRLSTLRAKPTPPPEPPVLKNNPRASAAASRALDWLGRHQDDDGRWDTAAFTKHDPDAERTGGGRPEYDVGVTALALLCFLEAGYGDIDENPFTINIEQALRFLRASQDEVGVYGGQASKHFIYNHAIATFAVCEALRRKDDPALRKSAKAAVDFLEAAQSAGWGWRYEPRGKESDTSVTCWCVRALAAAREAGIEVGDDGFFGALAWVDRMTDPATGIVGYNTPGGNVSRLLGQQLPFPAEQSRATTAAGLLVRILCGENPRLSAICRKHQDALLERPPLWDAERGSIDMYYWYLGTVAMRRYGGSRWGGWRNPMQSVCLSQQVLEGVHAGSWEPVDAWSEDGGRVYATAMMTLALIESAPALAR